MQVDKNVKDKVEVEFSKNGRPIEQVLKELFKNEYKKKVIEKSFK